MCELHTRFFLFNALIPALPLECYVSEGPVVSSYFLILRGKYTNHSCVCRMNFYLMELVQKWALFYGASHQLSFFIICSPQQNVNYILSVNGRTRFFFPCSVKEIWLLEKPAFSQPSPFNLNVITRPMHFISWVGAKISSFLW